MSLRLSPSTYPRHLKTALAAPAFDITARTSTTPCGYRLAPPQLARGPCSRNWDIWNLVPGYNTSSWIYWILPAAGGIYRILNLYEWGLVYPLYRRGIIVTVGYDHEPAYRSLHPIMIIAGLPAGYGLGMFWFWYRQICSCCCSYASCTTINRASLITAEYLGI